VFGIRVWSPAVTNADGWLHAGGELRLGGASLRFIVDLTDWRIADYERQWRSAIDRIARGAGTGALLTTYGGESRPHRMLTLWREDAVVYIQDQVVVAADLDAPFDPWRPDDHVGPRMTPERGVPLPEWRADFTDIVAAAFGLRLPGFPH
jgi:hypothetical protein